MQNGIAVIRGCTHVHATRASQACPAKTARLFAPWTVHDTSRLWCGSVTLTGLAILSFLPSRIRDLHRSCLQHAHLEALRSTELSGGLGRPCSSEEDVSPSSLGSTGKLGSSIDPELMDLSCMASPSSATSQEAHREEVRPFPSGNLRPRYLACKLAAELVSSAAQA